MKPALSPDLWPFEQSHVLLVLRQREHTAEQERLKTSTSIRDIELQSSDDEETGYSPSEDSETADGEEEDEEDGDQTDPMDVDVEDDEVLDLARDREKYQWPSSPTPSEKERADETKFKEELRILDAAEKDAASSYNPDEVATLLTDFYELLVEIGHWPEKSIQKPPHTEPTVNVELARTLAFDPAIVELMQKLPYVKRGATLDVSMIIPDSHFYDYTEERSMKAAKKHAGYDQYGTPIESWILPLAGPRNRDGWSVVLDTRLGVIRAYTPINGPPRPSIECRRHGEDDEGREGPLQYHRAPLVPAATYLRTLITCYRSMDRVPMMDAYHSDPDWPKQADREKLKWYFENMEDEQNSILALYKDCGWPEQWNRPTFMKKWEALSVELKERGRERMIRDGALT